MVVYLFGIWYCVGELVCDFGWYVGEFLYYVGFGDEFVFYFVVWWLGLCDGWYVDVFVFDC